MPIRTLGAETFVLSMSLHLQQLQIKTRYRMRIVGHTKFVTKACTNFAGKLRTNTGLPLLPRDWPRNRVENLNWWCGVDFVKWWLVELVTYEG